MDGLQFEFRTARTRQPSGLYTSARVKTLMSQAKTNNAQLSLKNIRLPDLTPNPVKIKIAKFRPISTDREGQPHIL